MNLGENIASAFAGLKANKMRAFLTMLGIIIGISSVIMITTMGTILEKSVTGLYDSLGANCVIFQPQIKADSERNYILPGDMITDEMIEIYKEQFGDRATNIALAEYVDIPGKTVANKEEYAIQLLGYNQDATVAANMVAEQGRLITDGDVSKNAMVCIISEKQAEKLYGKGNAIGQTLSVRMSSVYYDFTVVGVFSKKMSALEKNISSIFANEWEKEVYIPITTAQRISEQSISGYRKGAYSDFQANGAASENAEQFAKDTADFFNRAFYSRNPDVEVTYYTAEQEMELMNNILGIVKMVISIIAGISLLVGGIGVMNIMLVSVTERTREIGVRKALGAPNSAIRIQFITESMIICLIGGVIGIVGGIMLGNLAGLIIGTMAAPSLGAIIVSVLFSMAIGMFFGYYPANKAAKLDPIEALRYE